MLFLKNSYIVVLILFFHIIAYSQDETLKSKEQALSFLTENVAWLKIDILTLSAENVFQITIDHKKYTELSTFSSEFAINILQYRNKKPAMGIIFWNSLIRERKRDAELAIVIQKEYIDDYYLQLLLHGQTRTVIATYRLKDFINSKSSIERSTDNLINEN